MDPEPIIYYNVRIDNPFTGGVEQAAKTLIMTGPVLDVQSNFKMCVDYFNLNGDIPVFFCPILLGNNSDINATSFGVCIQDPNGNKFPSQVIYRTADPSLTVDNLPTPPSQNGGYQDFNSLYYAFWSIQEFLTLINEAWQESYNAFHESNPGLDISIAPWFQFNPTLNNRFSLIVPYGYYDLSVNLYSSFSLAQYFDGIQGEWTHFGAEYPDYTDVLWDLTLQPGNQNAYALPGATIPTPPTPPAYLQYIQAVSSLHKWCNIRSIVFTSSKVQTRAQYLPPVTNLQALPSAAANVNVVNPPTQTVLTYYDIIPDDALGWRQNLYSLPYYRKWYDLVGDGPLNQFDLQIFMQLVNGTLVPLNLLPNQVDSIKVAFQQKPASFLKKAMNFFR